MFGGKPINKLEAPTMVSNRTFSCIKVRIRNRQNNYLSDLLLVEARDGVECVEADEAALLGLAELAAEGVRQPLVGQQLVQAEKVPKHLKHMSQFCWKRLRECLFLINQTLLW